MKVLAYIIILIVSAFSLAATALPLGGGSSPQTEKGASPYFFNAAFRIQFQDTYKLEDSLYMGRDQSFTGNYALIGFSNYDGNNSVIRESDEIVSEDKRPIPIQLQFLEKQQIKITDVLTDKTKTVRANIQYDNNGEVLEFTVGGNDINEFVDIDFIKEWGRTLSNRYSFALELNRSIETTSNYRCRSRKGIIRCFVDIDYVYGTL